MKKKTLLSSILTIVLCVSLIAGSTFALFTDEAVVDVSVDAGNAEISASLTEPVLYSVEKLPDGVQIDPSKLNEYEFDENGKPYTYQQQTETFINGGTAKLEGNKIVLTNITPGDKITFSLNGSNDGDVALQYRYKFECASGYDLMSGCIVTVNGEKFPSMASYVSEWYDVAVEDEKDASKNKIEEVKLAFELPVSAGDVFQEKTAEIKITVEAVQSNADTRDTDARSIKYITTVDNSADLATKLASDEYLHIFVDKDLTVPVAVTSNLKDKTIDANGKNVNIQFGNTTTPVTLENVVVMNLVDASLDPEGITIGAYTSGDLTVKNSILKGGAPYSNGVGAHGAIAGNTTPTSLNLTVEGCELISDLGDKYGVYLTNINNLTVRDTIFTGMASWAIIVNGTVTGNVVITGCTFENCAGIVKTSVAGIDNWQTGSLNGNFTFANNQIKNCTMKDGKFFMEIKNIKGVVTFSNNTIDDVVASVEDMKCDYLTKKYNEQ